MTNIRLTTLTNSSHTSKADDITLVFLHGLLGSSSDFIPVITALGKRYHCISVDLPGHGDSVDITVDDFAHFRILLAPVLASLSRYILVGYSLGARLVMDYAANSADKKLMAIVIENGNTGLIDNMEKEQRWQNDLSWGQRFDSEDIVTVLRDWYRQPVFKSLNAADQNKAVRSRQYNNGPAIAKMLRATSLAKQSCFLDSMQLQQVERLFIAGDEDIKFLTIAKKSGWPLSIVVGAGHNVHHQFPERFGAIIENYIERLNFKKVDTTNG
ncbi:2-succinyl-6-hydroxy-2, 4-cyclohexadiene-1-carboxylate synthase [Sinobacterium norvegicum]|uniref:Putative 2-succinyl-6-hydroxy-2,4-cyclohexadiene-1-carboxylate synthase n=1 Tax=Sinobacterium norvegicum TaxID=1641715 RepID=A0ABM9AFE8_9GAMM|nr:2-succinyl-6-hydroxy-2,4-cyclohexadiene-1-carboxylate synthase [Sinobacterium norvegicum]CAH0991689.1 2-succinyl-6-hydroxy-2, 4-cyclohexadiene-1-carboxylate synthase [Sinobacterium norvegicum]